MTRRALTLAALVSLTASFAQAQSVGRPLPYYVHLPYAVATYHHASTYQEGVLRGTADCVRAQGLWHLMMAQAKAQAAEAARLETENRVASTQAFFTMREINRTARYGERPARPAKVVPPPRAERQRSQSPLDVVNPVTHEVEWPTALQGETFAGHRAVIERILAQAGTNGTLGGRDRSTLTQASRAMAGKLKDHIRELSTQDYLDAWRLLNTLAS